MSANHALVEDSRKLLWWKWKSGLVMLFHFYTGIAGTVKGERGVCESERGEERRRWEEREETMYRKL